MLKEYYRLAKPGIIYGNVLTTIAAFFFASEWRLNPIHFIQLFLPTIFGIGLVIGSACVFNNYMDRDIDRRMERTKQRALVTGAIPVKAALSYGVLIGFIGLALLYLYVNILTTLIALFGFFMYVVVYGAAKRSSHWGAVVGSIPGAVPIVVGYTAVTNQINVAAIILFLILVVWQMPHFYSIAMYRLEEYTAAGIPVLPAKKGMRTSKIHIVSYLLGFIIATTLLFLYGYVGYVYEVVLLALGIRWFWKGIQGFRAADDGKWARDLFFFSLIVLLSFCVMLAIARLVP